MDTLIYQTLGKFKRYRDISYRIEDYVKRGVKFSSQAIYSYYAEREGRSPKIIYVYPHSLSGNPGGDPDSLVEEAREEIGELVKDCDFDVLISNAIGVDEESGWKWTFKSTPGNIAVQVFLDMKDRLSVMSGKKLIIADLSSGYNLYAISVLDALKSLIVYNKLKNGIRDGSLRASYAISEPVIGAESPKGGDPAGLPKEIFIHEYDEKAFFELPISGNKLRGAHKLDYYVDLNDDSLKRKMGFETSKERKDLGKLMNGLVLMFNSIKMNAPLVLYMDVVEIHQDVEGLEERLTKFFKGMLRPEIKERVVSVPSLRARDIFNLFFSIALYDWIVKKRAELEGRATINGMRKAFAKIYEELGLPLNYRFLERDLKEIEGRKEVIPNDWTPLDEVLESEMGGRGGGAAGDEKRNFFAHSGLEKTVVEVKRCGEEIELRYSRDGMKKIKEWLLKLDF
ncbi:MAG: TM1812 family CRISPR-associated protein [Candidatus Bathyarchaeia archaeon]